MMKEMETTELSDTDLVAGSLTGNREACGRIVARYQTLICSLAYSGTGSLSQSEDLAQETFIAAWKQLANLRELHNCVRGYPRSPDRRFFPTARVGRLDSVYEPIWNGGAQHPACRFVEWPAFPETAGVVKRLRHSNGIQPIERRTRHDRASGRIKNAGVLSDSEFNTKKAELHSRL